MAEDDRERMRRERRKEKLERQLSRIQPEDLEEDRRNDEEQRRGSRKWGSIIPARKFRSTLKRKKCNKLLQNLQSIQDIRPEEQVAAVDKFREVLNSEGLLPTKHDDYHTILR